MLNPVYGSTLTLSLGAGTTSLPLHQKVLMATLLLMVKGNIKEVTLGKLMETYSNILKKRKMEVQAESACIGKFYIGIS